MICSTSATVYSVIKIWKVHSNAQVVSVGGGHYDWLLHTWRSGTQDYPVFRACAIESAPPEYWAYANDTIDFTFDSFTSTLYIADTAEKARQTHVIPPRS
jgi:hypothetical protein